MPEMIQVEARKCRHCGAVHAVATEGASSSAPQRSLTAHAPAGARDDPRAAGDRRASDVGALIGVPE